VCKVCMALSGFGPDRHTKLIVMNRPVESARVPLHGHGSAERRYTTPITSQFVDQQLEHQVTDEAVAAGRNAPRYQALCGQLFVAAASASPPGRPCPDCARILAAASRAAVPADRHNPRRRLLRRLLRRGKHRDDLLV
jgi:hypothetical protein